MPADLPAVWGDAEILRRVLVNLLDNALKFTPAGGQVMIQLAPDLQTGDDDSAGVLCSIEDNGPGIPGPYRTQIFDRFVRINVGGGQVRGTGLGLTFCKLAIEAHGGRIWVADAEHGGSRFVFTLPGVPRF
jgi:signal transduction histidine kinase